MADLPRYDTDRAKPTVDSYYWYYATLAMYQLEGANGGANWTKWNKMVCEVLLQEPAPQEGRLHRRLLEPRVRSLGLRRRPRDDDLAQHPDARGELPLRERLRGLREEGE